VALIAGPHHLFDTAPKRVAPGLYQGAMGWDETVEAAQSGVFDVVVLCAHDVSMPTLPPGVLGVYLPLMDAPEMPAAAWPSIWRTVRLVRDAVVGGRQRVLIACAMGLNRSSLIMGLVLRSMRVGGNEAVQMIKDARGPSALSNLYFRRLIERSSVRPRPRRANPA